MITAEKLQNHILHLQEKHDLLDKQIIEHYDQYKDDEKVYAEKVEKLRLADEIVSLKRQLETLGA